jgi:signal transduction histidine kinase
MLEETDRMTHLVDTLLRLSHGDAGTIRLNREPIDLGQLTRDVASSLGVLAEERQQKVVVDTCGDTIVPADRLVLREAITNVLDNAIKYSPAGSTIALRVGRDARHAAVTVSDQGPGIPVEHRERIFDRFFRIDEARSRAEGGAGLGLAIAKWAIAVHGGDIRARDAPGGGAEFRLELPLVTKT